jgi:hypothetical protein
MVSLAPTLGSFTRCEDPTMAPTVSFSKLLACMVATTVLVASGTAFAKKQKPAAPAPAATKPAAAATEPAADGDKKPAEGASQSADQERPKPVIDENQEAPATDEKGNVNFTGAHAGKGKIVIKGAAKESIKIYLEGRFFGTAPRTITGMPPGDYIVEGVFPDGKSLTKPVSVSGDEEVTVELAPSDAIESGPKEKLMPLAQAERRWTTAKIVAITSAGLLVAGGIFGYLTHTTQQDYDKAAVNGTQAQLDDLAKKGNRYSLIANTCFVLTGVGLIAAAVIGYPAYKARKAVDRPPESPDSPVSFLFAPSPLLDGGSASLQLRF